MIFNEIGLYKPEFDETWANHMYATRRFSKCYSRQKIIFSNKDSMIFHETGLHKPDSDENLYDDIYVTRRITACYSRGLNCSVGNDDN